MSLVEAGSGPRRGEGYRHRIAVPIMAELTIAASEALAELLLGNPA
jgi:hypothetical protein